MLSKSAGLVAASGIAGHHELHHSRLHVSVWAFSPITAEIQKANQPDPPHQGPHAQSRRGPTGWPRRRLGTATTVHAARVHDGQHGILYNSACLRGVISARTFEVPSATGAKRSFLLSCSGPLPVLLL
jgi:hypothetical protein